MMKKGLLSFALCASLLGTSAVFAADTDKDISVEVDKRTVYFEDQGPVIESDRTLVPLRGVLEAMDAKVEWDGEQRRVTVNSYDNRTRLILFIDNDEIKKLTFPSVTEVETETVTSDVAPKIINDRTMIPLRVISENLDADVDWDKDIKKVTIKTKQLNKALAEMVSEGVTEEEALAKNTVKMSIESDATEVSEGDSVIVKIKVENTEIFSEAMLSGVTATLLYDKDMLSYEGYKAYSNGEEVSTYAEAANGEFKNNSVKIVYLLDPLAEHALTDGIVTEVIFTANKSGKAEVSLSNRHTNLGEDTHLMIKTGEKSEILSDASVISLDTTALEIDIAQAGENTDDAQTETDAEKTDDAQTETDAEKSENEAEADADENVGENDEEASDKE